MIHDLKPYPAYRDSRVPWAGSVPEHWGIQRIKTLLRERSEKGFPDEPLLAATQTKGVVRKEHYENRTVLALKDLHLLKLVRVGDFVISLRSFQGGIEFARHQGIISPAYTILYPREPSIQPYLAWLFKSQPFVDGLTLFVTGIRQGQNIDYERLSRSYLPLPPSDEQAAIVRFLEHADRRIRRYIRAKQKLIKLLEEQKQAIIHRAVTRGLNPAVRLKPSGVEWLGEVPEHWEVVPFVRCAVERADYRGATPEKVESGVFLVTAKNIRKGWIDYESSREFVRADQYDRIMRRGLPRVGDILFTTEAPLGNVALVDREDVAFAQRIIRFRMDDSMAPRFGLYSMLSPYFQQQLEVRATGSTAQGIKASKLPQLQILRPPRAEQEDILQYVSSVTADLEMALSATQNEITLLHEYRTRLIADVVTGKLDVRAAAASLPNVIADGEAIESESEVLEDEGAATEDFVGELEEAEI